jgi:hypothetical protein
LLREVSGCLGCRFELVWAYWTAVSDDPLEAGESIEVERVEPRMRRRVRHAARA